jgi:hypothetical protein
MSRREVAVSAFCRRRPGGFDGDHVKLQDLACWIGLWGSGTRRRGLSVDRLETDGQCQGHGDSGDKHGKHLTHLPTRRSTRWKKPPLLTGKLSFRFLPLSRFAGAEDGFDDGHIGDGLFQWHGDFAAFEDGTGEGIALHGVLVGGGKFFDLDAIA